MSNEKPNSKRIAEVLEVPGLEYDVASVGSVEASASEENQAAFHLVFYRLPEQQG